MIVLTNEQLQEVLVGLPEHYPKSLQMASVIRSTLKDSSFSPGREIVVDSYPDYAVLMHRPIKDYKEDIPFPRVTIFCRHTDKLESVVRRDDFVDWSRPFTFFTVSKPDVHTVVLKRSSELGDVDSFLTKGEDNTAYVHLLHPSYIVRNEIPEGFRLGALSESDAEQVNKEWHYGTSETLSFMQSLIRTKVPTSAIFTLTGRLVAYIMSVEGCMFNGFVVPEYRNKGLYQVVNYDLASKLVAAGEPYAWLLVMRWNTASLSSYKKLGAKMIDPAEYTVDFVMFKPKTQLIEL